MAGETAQVEKASARWIKGKRKRLSVSQVLTRACRNAPDSIFTDNRSAVRFAVSLAALIPAGARGAAALLQMAVMSCDAGQGDVRLPLMSTYRTKAHEAFALPEPLRRLRHRPAQLMAKGATGREPRGRNCRQGVQQEAFSILCQKC